MSTKHEPRTRTVHFRDGVNDGGGTDGRTLHGLACPFDDRTTIGGWDPFDEEMAPGAFKRTLSHRTPVIQFEHGHHPLFGSLPIADLIRVWEDTDGLRYEAEIFESPLFEPLREALKAGAIGGTSIRFRPVRVEIIEPDDSNGLERRLERILEAELFELGPVVFPAYENTDAGLRGSVLEGIDFGGLDPLNNDRDRVRVVSALAALPSNGHSTLGTGGTEEAPLVDTGPASGNHTDNSTSTNRRRSLVARLETLESNTK